MISYLPYFVSGFIKLSLFCLKSFTLSVELTQTSTDSAFNWYLNLGMYVNTLEFYNQISRKKNTFCHGKRYMMFLWGSQVLLTHSPIFSENIIGDMWRKCLSHYAHFHLNFIFPKGNLIHSGHGQIWSLEGTVGKAEYFKYGAHCIKLTISINCNFAVNISYHGILQFDWLLNNIIMVQ